ncbi:uncharacterized protein LTR77_003164 [Saxophila tyrrhenica]|uniref:Uncharacterized protein n=1 Tax=Saxophila tyrrhenica TaxID=1690608 RepID=A0AAV9PJR8_9PEZI|nr:hypothetical protein LTR77_003164 [Saxophila tyrrhenica]
MASTNGALTPPVASKPPTSPSTNGELKRKREDEEPASAEAAPASTNQTQRDMLDILQPNDTTPSFLQHVIDGRNEKERPTKAARLSEADSSANTIASKLASGAYPNLTVLYEDAEYVRQGMITAIRKEAKDRGEERMSIEDLKRIQRVQAFAQVIANAVAQEVRYEAVHGVPKIKEEQRDVNGYKKDESTRDGGQGGNVLTLFGNAPTPKQLFSSTQRPLNGTRDNIIKTELPVEEMSLPNGLTATKIMPLPADDQTSGPTFEDVFAPPFNLPQLHPPKAQKRSTTRDNTMMWEFKDPVSRANRKGGYTTQSQTVADWLGYGGVDGKEEPSSPREKRKQRDRALSGGESSDAVLDKDSIAEAAAKEEEALFRRAYSSFAPSCDNSRALVSEETKSMMWWSKIGERRYQGTFAIDPALLDDRPSDYLNEPVLVGAKNELEEFGRVVEELEDLDGDLQPAELVRDKTDVEQVLQQISALLETLASHQRIRTASFPSSSTASRTPISPAPVLSSRIGRPDSPAEDEVTMYHSIRRELAYLILKLPPYAVAKLDGDQLADLGISKSLPFDAKDIKGTMEEDQATRMAKHNALQTAAGIASLTRSGSNNNQHYSSTSQRTPAIGQAANTRYGTQYGASRTPMQPSFQRSTSNQSTTYGTPGVGAPRPGYGQQPNQYSRPPSSSYALPNGQQGYYRGGHQTFSTHSGYNQQYPSSTPQTQQRSYSSSQPLAQYQQRAVNAAAYQSGQHRTASPIKPAGLQPIMQPQRPQQYQSGQPESGRGTPVSYPSQPPTPVNGYQQRTQAVAPRESSETPQPIAPAPHPLNQPAQPNGYK